MTERLGIGKAYAGQVDRAAAGQISREWDQQTRNVAIGAVVNQHDDGISLVEDSVADDQHPDASTAQRVVDDVTAGYHAASKSARAFASSPSREACHAAAAATLRRSR